MEFDGFHGSLVSVVIGYSGIQYSDHFQGSGFMVLQTELP